MSQPESRLSGPVQSVRHYQHGLVARQQHPGHRLEPGRALLVAAGLMQKKPGFWALKTRFLAHSCHPCFGPITDRPTGGGSRTPPRAGGKTFAPSRSATGEAEQTAGQSQSGSYVQNTGHSGRRIKNPNILPRSLATWAPQYNNE
jgi:hypothetical protein